jgi:hypothetical protein
LGEIFLITVRPSIHEIFLHSVFEEVAILLDFCRDSLKEILKIEHSFDVVVFWREYGFNRTGMKSKDDIYKLRNKIVA